MIYNEVQNITWLNKLTVNKIVITTMCASFNFFVKKVSHLNAIPYQKLGTQVSNIVKSDLKYKFEHREPSLGNLHVYEHNISKIGQVLSPIISSLYNFRFSKTLPTYLCIDKTIQTIVQ